MAASSAGCFPGPRGPVDLRDAEVKEIRLQLRHPRAAICPGEPVPLDVSIDAMIDGQLTTVRQHRDEIDEPIFSLADLHLESPQGTFEDGVFIPNVDARDSLGSGFVFYARAPRGPAFSVRFPPYYECGGKIGGAGQDGYSGLNLTEPNHAGGRPFSETIAGRHKADTVGGIDGGKGPRLSVYVTWGRTADYTRVLVGHSEGDIEMVTMVAPGYPLNVVAIGGNGGDGGKGMQGQSGAGQGGSGGDGGKGGDGGEVDVIVDERFPELEQMINVDVSGGQGGGYGPGGAGGERKLQAYRSKKRGLHYVPVGDPGKPGFPGLAGKHGEKGTFFIRRADIHPQFAGVAGLTLL